MGTLQIGSSGPQVEQLQRALAAAGFDPAALTVTNREKSFPIPISALAAFCPVRICAEPYVRVRGHTGHKARKRHAALFAPSRDHSRDRLENVPQHSGP
jgi:peptidoglycan hydrolase-like protein with peptidoglycan-binding domain